MAKQWVSRSKKKEPSKPRDLAFGDGNFYPL
ncbi:hypothetical protein COLO4_09978 [Corchorus olitorius]|uniref:Uncharacterized protein n=1 Tax=Corchorus olitorius TaxID=93759 RepID=A0A1R3KAE7_9ROSI|nr:hypothetical protein COLO4_09978 [Corchorus olitorius]